MRKNPVIALFNTLTLAIGIGVSTVIFSLVYNGFLHPFPYRCSNRLVAIQGNYLWDSQKRLLSTFSLEEIQAFRNGNHTFEDIVGYRNTTAIYSRQNGNESLRATAMTTNGVNFWGVQPAVGRGFSEIDVQPGALPVVLLSHQLWRNDFHGSQDAIGKSITLNGKPRTIIGIMPSNFRLGDSALYIPVSWNNSAINKEGESDQPSYFLAAGILKASTNKNTAAEDIRSIVRRLQASGWNDLPPGLEIKANLLNETIAGNFKQNLILILAATFLVLLICCSNVVGLMLVQASTRGREIALRTALGARRGLIIKQLLLENGLLALLGCATGCFFAYIGIHGVIPFLPLMKIPAEASIRLNLPVLAYAIFISTCSTLLCGLAPALQLSRVGIQEQLATKGEHAHIFSAGMTIRSILTVSQIAFSVFLLFSACLVFRSYITITHENLRVHSKNILIAQVHLPERGYATENKKRLFYTQLLSRLLATPNVLNASILNSTPLYGGTRSNVTIPGKSHRSVWMSEFDLCSDGFSKTLGLQILRGRPLTNADITSARKVVVINETFAKQYFPNEDPIGKHVKFDFLDQLTKAPRDTYFEVIGIVSDFYNNGVEAPETTIPEGFLPYTVSVQGDQGIALQTQIAAPLLAQSTREILLSLEPDAVLTHPTSLEELMHEQVYSRPQFNLITFGACAFLGFVLALIGLFSVMMYIVSLRIRDFGIYLALGAPRAQIFYGILRKSTMLLTFGSGAGLFISIGVGRIISSNVGNIAVTSPSAGIAVFLIVLSTGLCASLLPAYRACKVDPMEVLRRE